MRLKSLTTRDKVKTKASFPPPFFLEGEPLDLRVIFRMIFSGLSRFPAWSALCRFHLLQSGKKALVIAGTNGIILPDLG